MSRPGKLKRRVGFRRNKDNPHRGSIHAELMHIRMRRDMAAKSGNVGLDIGAGRLVNRQFFRTDRYIAVEPRQDVVDDVRANHPDAEIHVMQIEDYEPDCPVDIALAWTVIGNTFFDLNSTVPTVRRVTEWVAPGGAFIFDLRPRTLQYEAEVDAIVGSAFRRVEKRAFGRFRIAGPPIIVINAARALTVITADFAPRDDGNRSIYYACHERLG